MAKGKKKKKKNKERVLYGTQPKLVDEKNELCVHEFIWNRGRI